MDQDRPSSRMTVIGAVIAAVAIIGLAVVTSAPFQEKLAGTESAKDTKVAQDTSSETAKPSQAEDAAPSGDEAAAADSDSAASEDMASSPPPDQEAATDKEAAPEKEVVADASSEQDAAPEKEAAADASSDKDAAAATDAAADAKVECCKKGDQTPPLQLVGEVPPGGLHNPYDWKELVKEDPNLVKQFRLPGCNECHGGGGGGGFCPALSQGVWFWGNTDDVLFRLITQGSAAIQAEGFVRYQYGTVHAPMPPMGHTIKTADHLWHIISFIRSINPPGTNPPEKVIPGKFEPKGDGDKKAE